MISLLDIFEAALVVMQWYMALDSSILTTYANTASLLQIQKFAPILGWEATNIMLEQWSVFLRVLGVPYEKHCAVYELMLVIDVVGEVKDRLRAQSRHQATMTVAIVLLI